jgi:putative ABC transport system permease protein
MRLTDSKESVRMALDTLRKNKLRSGLTILGISIGISTVILISSAINGLNSNIDQFVSSLGTNDLWVFRFDPFGQRLTTEELNRKQLTMRTASPCAACPMSLPSIPA